MNVAVAGIVATILTFFATPVAAIAEKIDLSVEPIQPIPLQVKIDARKVSLGERLFNDPRLSGDSSISCAHCHSLEQGGVDGSKHSLVWKGVKGRSTHLQYLIVV